MDTVMAGHKRTQMSLNVSSSWARSSFKLNSFPHPFLMILLTQGEGTAARITHKAEGCVANLGYLTQEISECVHVTLGKKILCYRARNSNTK